MRIFFLYVFIEPAGSKFLLEPKKISSEYLLWFINKIINVLPKSLVSSAPFPHTSPQHSEMATRKWTLHCSKSGFATAKQVSLVGPTLSLFTVFLKTKRSHFTHSLTHSHSHSLSLYCNPWYFFSLFFFLSYINKNLQ